MENVDLQRIDKRLRSQRRGLFVLFAIVVVQAVFLAYALIPFGGPAKHGLTLQAGKVELIDLDGKKRIELSADYGQGIIAFSDAKGRSMIRIRENDTGFVLIEIDDPRTSQPAISLFSGTKTGTYIKLHDAIASNHIELQADEGKLRVTGLDSNGKLLPKP